MAKAEIQAYTPDAYIGLKSGPDEWLVENFIPKGGSGIVWGSPKAGKSCLSLGLALALGNGEPFLSFPQASAKVLYIMLDNPRTSWRRKMEMLKEKGLLRPETNIRFVDRESAPYPFSITNEEHMQALRALVNAERPDLVVIDTLRESYRGDENDSDRLQQVMSTFSLACRPAALLYVHHGKKPPSDEAHAPSLMDSGRGSSYIPGAVDTVMSLRGFKPHLDKSTGEIIRKGTLTMQGRTLEEQDLALHQDQDTYLWTLAPSKEDPAQKWKAAVAEVLSDALSYETDKERVEELARRFGKSPEACQKAITRAKRAMGDVS